VNLSGKWLLGKSGPGIDNCPPLRYPLVNSNQRKMIWVDQELPDSVSHALFAGISLAPVKVVVASIAPVNVQGKQLPATTQPSGCGTTARPAGNLSRQSQAANVPSSAASCASRATLHALQSKNGPTSCDTQARAKGMSSMGVGIYTACLPNECSTGPCGLGK